MVPGGAYFGDRRRDAHPLSNFFMRATLGTIFDDAVALLAELSGPHGIHASLASTANYRAVFARDAVMAGIAGLVSGSDAAAAGLVRTL